MRENPRAALLRSNGTVYLSWASSCDVGPYHGWLMAYDAQSLKQKAVFNTSPDADDSGIWASNTGPAADRHGNIFVATGNGHFDAAKGGRDYGDTLLKLNFERRTIKPADYFTSFNVDKLDTTDGDLGSGGPVLLPDQPGRHPHSPSSAANSPYSICSIAIISATTMQEATATPSKPSPPSAESTAQWPTGPPRLPPGRSRLPPRLRSERR